MSLPLCMIKDIECHPFCIIVLSLPGGVRVSDVVVVVMTKAIAAQNAKTILRSNIHKHRVRAYHDIFHFSDLTVIQYYQDHPSQYEKRQPIVAQWVIVTDFGPYPSGQTSQQRGHGIFS